MSMYAKYENCSLCYGRGWVGEGEGGCMNQCPDCASRRTRDAANSRERKLRDRITELEAQVLALQSWQMAWQPIETAPKDGSFFLATDGEEYSVTYWSPYDVELYDGVGWRDDGDMGWGGMIGVSPTHWMPLPPAPLPGEPSANS